MIWKNHLTKNYMLGLTKKRRDDEFRTPSSVELYKSKIDFLVWLIIVKFFKKLISHTSLEGKFIRTKMVIRTDFFYHTEKKSLAVRLEF